LPPNASPQQVAKEASDDALLDRLQRSAFDYFLQTTNPHNGLIADTTRDGAPSGIAVVGIALSAYPVGVERGWVEPADAVQRTLVALQFFMGSDQSGGPDATGYRGYYFHFLDMQSGTRVWLSELSLIDTAFLIAGALTAAMYFTADTPAESELRRLAEALYRRVDWRWAQRDRSAVMHGWKPECGFPHYGWEGYSEAMLLYVPGRAGPRWHFRQSLVGAHDGRGRSSPDNRTCRMPAAPLRCRRARRAGSGRSTGTRREPDRCGEK